MSESTTGHSPTEPARSKTSWLSRVSVAQWVALVVTVLALVFVLQNRDRVTIHLLQIEVGSPMWLVLLVMFVAGWLAGVLVRWRRGRRG